ncbi:hypothetical protein MPSEU_000182900 [Mayamaea pseudoterrestris]|nr:hypothetical protein MPSEU_000182900 [Mayamaea pseudoterrestris]
MPLSSILFCNGKNMVKITLASKPSQASVSLTTTALSAKRKNTMPRPQTSAFPLTLFSNTHKAPEKYKTILQDYIWTVNDVLSPTECRNWIEHMEKESHLMQHNKQRATRYMAHRECFELRKDDPDVAQKIFERFPASLLQILPLETAALGCNPNIRLYKYIPGHKFGMHVDVTDTVPPLQGSNGNPTYTRVTVLIYLSECKGGATRFERPHGSGKDIVYVPKIGSMLLHLHGDDCLPHAGDLVEKGIKYVFRTDLVFSE